MSKEREGQRRGSDGLEKEKEKACNAHVSYSLLHGTQYTVLLPGLSVIVG